MMKKWMLAALVLMSLVVSFGAAAEDNTTQIASEGVALVEQQSDPVAERVLTEYRWFVNQYRYYRTCKVTYYKDVYAYNHGEYYLTPFDSKVPSQYFVIDESGTLAIAPIVLDITDAMRERLYGGDFGETILFYGQYCERIRAKNGNWGFSGVHEGIDFIYEPGAPLHAILGGVVTRAGDSNGTVGIYNEEMDITLLYLHCEEIEVRRGDVIEAGEVFAVEGEKGAGKEYTHVELRVGRHTSSNAYRNSQLESDCPYGYMQEALGVMDSGRQAQTAAAVARAQELRAMAEEAARARAEAEAEAAEQEQEPEVELIDTLPGVREGYGFASDEATDGEAQEETPAAETTPIPEATLPPSNAN